MRDVVHCVALAVGIVTMAVFSSSGVCAASAPPTSQAAHQAAAPPAKDAPAEARGKVSPVKPATQVAHQAAVPPAEAGHGAASAKPTAESARNVSAADPVAHATEAVERVNLISEEQAPKRTPPSAGQTPGAAVQRAILLACQRRQCQRLGSVRARL